MSGEHRPIDSALDLLVFAPLGLAIRAAEEVPELAARGRAELTSRFATARVVGQFAVARGRQELERRMAGRSSTFPAQSDGPAFEETYDGRQGRSAEEDASWVAPGAPGPAGGVPAATGLAIPGYDSLSASQVVQRLAGLTPEELAAVASYEAAHRGRRTILNRVEQLKSR